MNEPTQTFVVKRFGLRPAEARVAAHLACTGDTTDDIARSFGRSHGTVAAQLRAVMARLNVDTRAGVVVEVWRAWTEAFHEERKAA